MKTVTNPDELRHTAATQWPTIRAYYRDDNQALGLIADFIQHPESPATFLKAAMINAALEG
ncbi:hypothetical protein ACTQ49_10485 [Luteococcus sp. Sow4_B9]|uniref:hypothetical protein n=1 Tax=Luteococcus sp. Sow4_B9 TaxID=3438792 RepID=UPI003F9AE629